MSCEHLKSGDIVFVVVEHTDDSPSRRNRRAFSSREQASAYIDSMENNDEFSVEALRFTDSWEDDDADSV